ncbi:hypothetical protein ZYGR_0W00520 [Zygosaccharomyces rouxii]|uniref:non-specific serine/threonine protein kinase n=2 Tax=Zygosaccharomyces rouxii TaxID=4956 RepID=C5DZ13_ZYGRC|nr:uncharacterized protein ZYRO0F17402g [Zygosaccharomyces rouxii]GAV50526.1 hypothetical protein ZYGR_0W00520 [Zygosaccharomyces rouxii]CAQ43350.1 Probable serine/threonine-protein kinase KCC4 and Serine/threonine-protein kinase GIN4 [Zygosaccharomyces rouxii]CAR29024.1 ZYRO0F17402p [Zygosaccharomyces rouxii]
MSGMNKRSAPTVRGDKVGPWKLGETLGFGSTGKVQLACNEITQQSAAVKEISKAIFSAKTAPGNSSIAASTPDPLPYGIEREIIIMKLLNHPNVLRLYDVWETNPSLYMVLEYAEKGELFNLLVENGPLPENEAVCFFRQIIIGVSYCHALGIVHRDLKPENLLLDHDLNIKIADFGMAALETEDKLLETSCGSPHYAAPEIVSGIPYHGFASDIWSCGVIFFALLTGRLPFDEEDGNIRNLLLKVQSGKFEMPDDDEISPEAQDLLAKILTVDPECRIKPREILKHPLLQKYPNVSDNKSIRNLPREDTYLHPLSDSGSSEVDQNILQNLVVLWHGRPAGEIAAKLKDPGANAEKTLYALLARFKNDTEREAARQKQIKKRSSLNGTGAGVNNNHVSPKKRNRASTINASSSHKRPVSLIKLSGSSNSNSNSNPSSTSTTPPKRMSVNLSSNKRLSTVKTQGNGGSPTPASRSKRVSIIESDKNGGAPPVPIDMLKDYNKTPNSKRLSRASVRLSFKPTNKRGSVTTKLISTYAKLSEEDDWEYIEKETKRTSSDFATLIDEIFEHEKFEQIRKEKAELERRVKETKEREERERKEREEKELNEKLENDARQKREMEAQEAQGDDGTDTESDVHSNNQAPNGVRSVSAPLERKKRDSMVNVQSDIEEIFGQRTMSLQTRPVSRLDPGLFYAEESNEPEAGDTEEEKKLRTQKNILETIRRSKFLGSSFDIGKELQNEELKKKASQPHRDRTVSQTNEPYDTRVLPTQAVATAPLRDQEPRKISEISVPQFTRKSRFFSDSNKRLSVLSMYSTKHSYNNLSNLLNDSDASDGRLNSAAEYSDVKGKKEPEFQFEAVREASDEDNGISRLSNNDERLRNVSGTSGGSGVPHDNLSSKHNMKLNFADRFSADEPTAGSSNSSSASKNVKLPTLPPLDGTSEANGLGIYQSSSESFRDIVEPTPKSKLQDNSSNPEQEVEEEVAGREGSVKHSAIDTASKERSKRTDRIDAKKPSSFQENLASAGASKGPPLNDSMPKRRNEDPRNGSTAAKGENGRAPLKDITTNSDKKRNVSFFRKFSKSNEKDTTGFDGEINTTVSAKQLFLGLQNLLHGWTQYGLKDVRSHPEKMTLTGKLTSENILSLRSTLFEMVVWSRGKVSVVGFRKKSGSSKAMRRLVSEVEKVLLKEGVISK